MTKPSLDYAQTDTGDNPQISVILMHGIGDHGSSFVPLVPEFRLSDCPPIRFIFPHAPMRPITANMGYEMPAWFDIVGGFDSTEREDLDGVKESQKLIEELIEQEKARGVPTSKIFLAGFSQGCAMALETALTGKDTFAGVIALSGYIPALTTFSERYNPANKNVPVFLAHGIEDPVVPIFRAEDTRDVLTHLGQNLSWHSYHMPHTLCMQEVADISDWLRERIKV